MSIFNDNGGGGKTGGGGPLSIEEGEVKDDASEDNSSRVML